MTPGLFNDMNHKAPFSLSQVIFNWVWPLGTQNPKYSSYFHGSLNLYSKISPGMIPMSQMLGSTSVDFLSGS